jgi:Secretion system C-terminal sorting domain
MRNKCFKLSLSTVLFTVIFVTYYKRNKQKLIPVQQTNYISFTLKQTLMALSFMVLCAQVVLGQAVAGWEKKHLFGQLTTAYDCIQTVDEGFIVVGEHEFSDAYIIRTNPDGIVRWAKEYDFDSNLNFGFKAIAAGNNNNYVAAGFGQGFGSGGSKDVFVVNIDNTGDTIWTNIIGLGFDDEANDIVATTDGGYAMVGYIRLNNGPKDVYLIKLNSDGDTLWTKQFDNLGFNDEGNAIIEMNNGDLVITGYTESNIGVSQALLLRTTVNGELIWLSTMQGATVGNDIIQTPEDDGFLIAGTNSTTNITQAVTVKVNFLGNFDGAQPFNNGLSSSFHAVARMGDGEYVFAGLTEPSATNSQGYLVKTNELGFVDADGWEKTFGKDLNFNNESFYAVTNTFDGGLLAVGNATPDVLVFNYSYYLLKTKSAGEIYSNYIEGQVFYDVDGSNDFTPGDLPIEGWVVEAIGEEETCYGTSQADGKYSILADIDLYDIVVRKPNDYWSSPSFIDINIPNPDDTLNINFAVQEVVICPDLEVDISTAGLTPGGSSRYHLTLCNDGTATANDPYIDVIYDEAFTINGVSENFTFNGNVLRIEPENLDLAPFDCKEITIDVTLSSDLIEGETHSMMAHAYPDDICGGGGDGSHLEVSAVCEGDEVKFTITNTGVQAMSTVTDYVIIEDMVMLSLPQSVGPLQPNETLEIPKAANGSTYRIFTTQTPGHPGDSRPTIAIEGCGDAGGGSFSTGFVNQFPEDDYDHFLSVDCQENVNTLLPNESRGYPKGYDSATDSAIKNEISKCTDLKYIHRFQNTGPDTAIRVVIQDTLSRFLDPASVRPGASSHDYRMEVYACGILRFTFENIVLPGSSTDPQASEVFVKYRVSQRPDSPEGAVVDNSAAAYFDYKAPVKTDSIYHTIAGSELCAYEEFVDLDTTTHVIYVDEVEEVNIYPNPFHSEMTVEIIGELTLANADFVVYDLTGRELRRESIVGKTFRFDRKNMATGMYLYLIESEGRPVSTGKIIAQ